MRLVKVIFCYAALAVLEWRTKWKIHVVAEPGPALLIQTANVGVGNDGMGQK